MAIDFNKWSKEELVAEVERLRKRKKYGLVWEDKPEDVVEMCKSKLPVLVEDEKKQVLEGKEKPTNILIEGDNFHALSVLNYTHKGKIDVIYIDPPYNTGAKDWKYNNNFVDKNDAWRHSKWLSLIRNRLSLAKALLKKNGVILVAIDDHEVHNLRHLLDDIMGEKNYISTVCAEVNPAGQNIRQNAPAISHDYCLIYAKSIDDVNLILRDLSEDELASFDEEDENGRFAWDNLRRRGGNSTPADRPGQWFPLYIHPKSKKISLDKFSGAIETWPIDPKGIKRIWRVNPAGFTREYANGNIELRQIAGRLEIQKKSYEPEGRKPKTLWKEKRHSATTHGTKLLINILGKNTFTYPKSLYLVKDCLKYWLRPDGIVLDFFAGSGTTGHAVLEMNNEDNGRRQFILCTNNENDIASAVCYPRIRNVVRGYTFKGDVRSLLLERPITFSTLKNCESLSDDIRFLFEQNGAKYEKLTGNVDDNSLRIYGVNNAKEKVPGLGGNLKYFKTAFVDAEPTDKNKRHLTSSAIELLCLREGTFDLVLNKKDFKIFRNPDRFTAILFDPLLIPEFKKELVKIDGPINVYVFSLGGDMFEEDFEDLKEKVTLAPIPEAIMRVYRRIFK